MKNPFKRTGFDSLISAGTTIHGALELQDRSTTIIDGVLVGPYISTLKTADRVGSTLVVGGKVTVEIVDVLNLTLTGEVRCERCTVPGLLSIKAGAVLTVKTLEYNELVIENGAMLTVTGSMSKISEPKTQIQIPEPEVQ